MISVCICTFKRPQLLSMLLSSIFTGQSASIANEIIVIDNDPNATARAVTEQFFAAHPFPYTYQCQAENNISNARNAAVALAAGDWVAFVDDDEEVSPRWLPELLACAATYQADAVFGPVVSVFNGKPPSWALKIFNRNRFPTGTDMPLAETRTGNVLVRRDLLLSLEGPFDPEYGLTGGGDHEMFSRFFALGTKNVWCDEAPVTELVPPERLKISWLLQRSFRYGNVNGSLARSRFFELPALAKATVALGIGLCLAPFAVEKAIKYGRIAAFHCGRLAYRSGYRYFEYGK